MSISTVLNVTWKRGHRKEEWKQGPVEQSYSTYDSSNKLLGIVEKLVLQRFPPRLSSVGSLSFARNRVPRPSSFHPSWSSTSSKAPSASLLFLPSTVFPLHAFLSPLGAILSRLAPLQRLEDGRCLKQSARRLARESLSQLVHATHAFPWKIRVGATSL